MEVRNFLHSCTVKTKNFQGGQLSKSSEGWKRITNDFNILSIITNGDTIEFEEDIPNKHSCLNQYEEHQVDLIVPEVQNMVNKGIIKECFHERKEFVSPIFITPKSDGGIRLILNLKELNKAVKFRHFKMQTIKDPILMINQGDFMTSIDLKDAYYSVQCTLKSEKLFSLVGFVVHPIKSQLLPSQRIVYLGFVIDSVKMILTLAEKRKHALKAHVNSLINIRHPSIRYVAKVIGHIISSLPASKFGALHYRKIEKDKDNALK